MLSPTLEKTLISALGLATDKGHEFSTLEHLLYALTEDADAAPVLKACSLHIKDLRTQLARYIDTDLEYLINPKTPGPSKPTTALQRVLQRAVIHMQSSGRTEVNGAHVLVALFSEKESHAVYFLQEQNITRFDAINFIAHGISKAAPKASDIVYTGIKSVYTHKDDSLSKQEKILKSCCTNLNEKARAGKIDPLIGREIEIDRTIQILCRRSKNNPLYVGDPGVGKTAIAAGLATRIVAHEVPEVLQNAVIYSLDMAALLAGTTYRGEFEEKLRGVLEALQDIPDSILFIDEIHTLIRAGAVEGGSMDAANILKPALADGSLRCMGATTYQEYRQYFEKDAALTRRFQKIDVPEPTIEQAIAILHGLRARYEKHHKVRYTDAAIDSAVRLSAKYISGRKLPDKAIDIMDEVGAAQLLLPPARRKTIIDVGEIEGVVAALARIPPKTLSGDDAVVLKGLEDALRAQVFDQDEAVHTLSAAMKLSRAGLREGEKPVGSYLFTGPTGVGKTEVARALARVMGLELLRFDMSEYAEKHALSRLIGSPPGYVGSEEGGQLTNKMEKHPRCVLLFDEIEKAHPDIFNIFLQIMDNATLTDNHGKTIDFRGAILIMTSNAGAREMDRAPVGFGRLSREGEDEAALKDLFSPEFRNRLDAIVPFHALKASTMERIVDKLIATLEAQLADRDVKIHLSEDARNWLARKGYDPSMGARPLARLIQEKIKQPLAEEILFGALAGGGTVVVGYADGLTFTYCAHTSKAKGKKEKV